MIPEVGAAREGGRQGSSPGAEAGPGAVSIQCPHLPQMPLETNRSRVCRSLSYSASSLSATIYSKHCNAQGQPVTQEMLP